MDFQHIEATFGKLEHCSLSFSSGLNIIEAPNESGKSTLLAFLRVMLYGFPPRERGALADKNRYAPWSLSPMRGTLSLSSQKGNITLQRDTTRANSPMGRFSAIYTGSGESVDGLTAADCGETLLGIPCEVSLTEHHADTIGLKKSGCHGFCEMGPLVHIEPMGVMYIHVKPEDCHEILEKTVLGGEVIDRLVYHLDGTAYPKQEDIPFYKKQHRVVLENCGTTDAEDIDEYLAHDGYAAFEKALSAHSAKLYP